jgi:hypothetical protein
MVSKKSIKQKNISKSGQVTATTTVDQAVKNLVSNILIPQCETVFNSNESNDTIFVSACNAIENSLRHYLSNQSTSIDFRSMRLFIMIDTVNNIPQFPKDFIGFFSTVRIKSNTRHSEMEAATEIDLLILKLEFYKYINWFVCKYLKQDEIVAAKSWFMDFENKFLKNNTTPKSQQVIATKISENDKVNKVQEISRLNDTIAHQQKVINGLLRSEKEKVQIINNLK